MHGTKKNKNFLVSNVKITNLQLVFQIHYFASLKQNY